MRPTRCFARCYGCYEGRRSPQGRAPPPTFEKPREERAYEKEVSSSVEMCQQISLEQAARRRNLAPDNQRFCWDFPSFSQGAHRNAQLRFGILIASLAWFGCSPPPSPPVIPPPVVVEMPDHFSGEIAKSHLDSLSAQSPRAPGSEADAAAREYLSQMFRAAGATVKVFEDDRLRHLVAELPGESEDTLLLVAAYPSLDRDEWIGDSGAALLLELARVWPPEHSRYTLRLALAEARGSDREDDDTETPDTDTDTDTDAAAEARAEGIADGPIEARLRVVSAGESLARTLEAAGELEGLRCIIVFDGIGRSGLRIARDLRSHPVYRELFWASGRRLGFESIFPPNADWASPRSLNLGFAERTTDGVVAIVDETRARPELEPIRSVGGGSADSFEAIGLVTIEALGQIVHRLSRIDDFDSGAAMEESAADRPIESRPNPGRPRHLADLSKIFIDFRPNTR